MVFKAILVLLNVAVILLTEVFIDELRQLSVNASILLQKEFHANYHPQLLKTGFEAIGPEPRVFTFVLICLLAKSGKEARRLLFLRFAAHYLRWGLGILLQEPRPFWIDERVEMLRCPVTFGLPSGHAIFSVVVTFPLAYHSSRNSGVWLTLTIIWFTMMCIGRVYLGTHSVHDLWLGIMLGLSLLYLLDSDTTDLITRTVANSDRKFVLSSVVVFSGVATSYIWSNLMSLAANQEEIKLWEGRVKQQQCSILHLLSAKEGIHAFAGLAGLLIAICRKHFDLPNTISRRLLPIVVYLLTIYLPAIPFLPKSLFLSSLGLTLASYLLFQPAPFLLKPGAFSSKHSVYYGSFHRNTLYPHSSTN